MRYVTKCAARAALAASIVQPAVAEGQGHSDHEGARPEQRAGAPAHSMAHDGVPMPRRPLDLPESRDASGTAWQPDVSPMHAVHAMLGDAWSLMVHGSVFVGYDVQGSDRGDREVTSQSWIMAMIRRSTSRAEIGARVMLSAEPLTVGPGGYPLLLQTGETYRGAPLHDRQHPHDLVMEAAVIAAAEVIDGVGLQLYVAPAGEPALGPVAFPHRPSAASDPLAPLGHHWQDATHITYGVVTAGVFTRRAKLEGSWFNGREPDEARYDLDLRVPDSFSARLTVQPIDALSVQASYGFLASPEAIEPEESVHRVTTSAMLGGRLGESGRWATTAVFGGNFASGEPSTPSFLVEADVHLDAHHVVFGRAEYVRKTGRDLALPPASEDLVFNMGSLALGYLFEVGPIGPVLAGIGARGAANLIGAGLEPFYGTRLPLGAMVFLRLRPALMSQ